MKKHDRHKSPKTAIALHYDGKRAPRISAKGQGLIAEQIIELAQAHGIPLQEDEQLTHLLSHLELGQEIPQQLYVAIAEVIAFAYIVTGRFPEGYTGD